MTKKIIVFGASNSKQSINKQFAVFTANRLEHVNNTVLDLNDFELPVYSVDIEKESGIPENAIRFCSYIRKSDAIIISLAEHNGLHTSAFKNLWDWLSRIPSETPLNIWDKKPMFLLSTSPSKRPQSNVMKVSKQLFPLFGAKIIAEFYLPSFAHFFKNKKIIEPKLKKVFEKELLKFQTHLNSILL